MTTRDPRDLLIVEPQAGGHHFQPYLSFVLGALVANGYRPWLMTTARARAHPAMAALDDAAQGQLRSVLMPDPYARPTRGSSLGLMAQQLRYWRAVASGYRALAPELRFGLSLVMGYDSMSRVLALRGSPLGGCPFVALSIHTKHHWPALGIGAGGRALGFSRWCFERVLRARACGGMLSIDQTLIDAYAGNDQLAPKLRWLPDPGEVAAHPPRAQARAALGLDAHAPMVLAYGVLDQRKRIDALLAAALLARCQPQVVLAGSCAAVVDALKASAVWSTLAGQGRLHLLDRYVDVADEARLFAAVDLVWVGYGSSFDGQSAVIAQAASAGRVLLGRAGGLIGRTIERHRLGAVTDPDDQPATAAQLDRLLASPPDAAMRDNLRRFAASRSCKAYADAWLAALNAWAHSPMRQSPTAKE